MKVYRGYDLKLRLFRPERNSRRMLNSATRIALPAFDPDELQKLIETLVAVDGEKVSLPDLLPTYMGSCSLNVADFAAFSGYPSHDQARSYISDRP